MKIKFFVFLGTLLSLFFISSVSSQSALLTYSFDDGHHTNIDARNILSRHGQVGTAAIITSRIDLTEYGFMTMDQVHELENSGWEIVSHSVSHVRMNELPLQYGDDIMTGWQQVNGTSDTYSTSYSYPILPLVFEDGVQLRNRSSLESVTNTAGSFYFDSTNGIAYVHTRDGSNPVNHDMRSDSAEKELSLSKELLTQYGFTVTNFIIPYTYWNADLANIARKYYNSSGIGYSAITDSEVNDLPLHRPHFLTRYMTVKDTEVSEVKEVILEAIEKNQWVILILHDLEESDYTYSWSPAKLDELAAWVAGQNIEVVTQQQGLDKTLVMPMSDAIRVLLMP